MSLEDPFLIVQNEVFDSLHKLRNNFQRLNELQLNPHETSREDYSSFVTELKNGLKSIQWDLDELEESLENSERTLNLDKNELQQRKKFIKQTRDEIQSMNEQLTTKGNLLKFKKPDFSLNFGGVVGGGGQSSSSSPISSSQQQQLQDGTKYYRLINEPDTSTSATTTSMMKNFDDDEHKSPYVTNHSITIDEADHNIQVISGGHNKFDELRRYWSSISVKQKFIAGFSTTATLLVLLIIWLL